ncbi:MAG TPA: STAS domain-containing protein [Steroidobacteraceae bacterium]|nr:STAS domain-containing protein [Steroidobacteraceae bacterium]
MKKRSRTTRATKRTLSGPAKRATLRPRRAARPTKAPVGLVALPADCMQADVATLKERLSDLLQSVTPITIDAAGVQRIDTASMQLLAAFIRERRSGDRAVALAQPSAAFADAVRLLGLNALMAPT